MSSKLRILTHHTFRSQQKSAGRPSMHSEDVRDRFQEMILAHNEHPLGLGDVDHPTHDAVAYNPFCGDRFHIRLTVSDGAIQEIGFDGMGCALSRASASMMVGFATGRTVSEFGQACQRLASALKGGIDPEDRLEDLGDAGALLPARSSPHRVRCALLAWDAACRSLGLQAGRSGG